ncbi:hypothetical protein [Nocardia sp. NPDC057353]|uniref:hypothetical protein n=1 Tax=Nocardia sp. NPDC057353 TaxID=3346104 RepID=UPI003645D663
MTAGFGALFERVTVLHNSADWQASAAEFTAVLGEPTFSDGSSWAAFAGVSLGDEAALPPWCLLARTADLDRVAARAVEIGWSVGPQLTGGHELRRVLTAPSGLVVIAYLPLR